MCLRRAFPSGGHIFSVLSEKIWKKRTLEAGCIPQYAYIRTKFVIRYQSHDTHLSPSDYAPPVMWASNLSIAASVSVQTINGAAEIRHAVRIRRGILVFGLWGSSKTGACLFPESITPQKLGRFPNSIRQIFNGRKYGHPLKTKTQTSEAFVLWKGRAFALARKRGIWSL